MLIGEYQSPLGEKNRVALPKKFRLQMSDNLIITRGYEHCLIIVDQARWLNLITEINRSPLLSLSVRDTKRFLLGGAYDLELDKQGRFVIPEALTQYARIESNLVFVGVGEWMEIWEQDTWQQKLDYLAENSADIAERLADKNQN